MLALLARSLGFRWGAALARVRSRVPVLALRAFSDGASCELSRSWHYLIFKVSIHLTSAPKERLSSFYKKRWGEWLTKAWKQIRRRHQSRCTRLDSPGRNPGLHPAEPHRHRNALGTRSALKSMRKWLQEHEDVRKMTNEPKPPNSPIGTRS